MKLYHGTNANIESIDLSCSRLGKDFGIGFYLTDDFHVAMRQAQRKFTNYGTGKPKVYAYYFDEHYLENQELKGLRVLRFEGYTEQWAKFILENRRNRKRKQIHSYDIVIGPIADDTVGYQIRRVEEGIINLQQFLEEIKYHTITMQYMFATELSLTYLRKL